MAKLDQQDYQALCKIEASHSDPAQKPITVGDVLKLQCTWPPSIPLTPPVQLEFLKTKTPPFALVILETKDIFPGKGFFKVTSYQPGIYNTPFKLISSSGTLHVDPLSWQVESVLPTNKPVTPYPPYGPWAEALPLWYWLTFSFMLLGLMAFIALKTQIFIKRKQSLATAQKRLKGEDPWAYFINQLPKPHQKNGQAEVQKAFRMFLENKYGISALGKKPSIIARQLKRYANPTFKKHGKSILEILTEGQKLADMPTTKKDTQQMVDIAREVVTKLSEKP